VIKEEKHPEDKSERKCETNPFYVELLEMHKPGTTIHWSKGCTHGKRQWASRVEAAPICHSGGCDESEWHAIIRKETTDMSMEKG
jgi:hypothetical protein